MTGFRELLEGWRVDPHPEATRALCAELSARPDEDLAREVGARAEQWHVQDGEVMLDVGRMYLATGLLAESQTALVHAGKANARDPRPFRMLGEVLLRRGDAARAEKVLARASQLGASDAETKLWHDRSLVYVSLQKRVGPQAVAAEVARTLPLGAAGPRSPNRPPHQQSPAAPGRAAVNWGEESPTIRHPGPVPPAARPPLAERKPRSVPPPLPPKPVTGLVVPGRPRPPSAAEDDESTHHYPGSTGAAQAPEVTGTTTVRRPPPEAPLPPPGTLRFDGPSPRPVAPQKTAPLPPMPHMPPSAPQPAYAPQSFPAQPEYSEVPDFTAAPAVYTETQPAYPAPPPAFTARQSAYSAQRPAYPAPQPAYPARLGASQPAYVPRQPSRPENYVPIPRAPLEESDELTEVQVSVREVADPTPEMVLESLARVGLFEPQGGAAPAWEAAAPQRSRGTWLLVLATFLVLSIGGGGYAYARRVQAQRVAKAKDLSIQVETMLESADMAQLRSSDEKLTTIFELDSRSPRAARLWLENRVLGTLILPGETRGVDAAVHRARSVDVPEAEVAFGKVASYLVEGDLAGAAAALPKFDKDSGKDAFYQLTAGAVLERAGDIRAVERYEAARALEPKLVAADILLARVVLLELGPEKGKPVIEELKKKTGETAATRALEALAWAMDPERPKELPKSALLSEEDRTLLIAPLLPIPAVVDALQSISGGFDKKAIVAIDSAIDLSDSPAMATQLGFLAIKADDEKLARKAALRALSFSALYPQARVLASRVALLGGRLDEAKKAIEELDPKSQDVAVVRAVLAYETLDLAELSSAIEVLGGAETKNPDYAALVTAPAVLMGGQLPTADALSAMASPSVPWGELVAVDAALSQGDMALAEKLIGEWGDDRSRPVYALRVARLERYRDKFEEADKVGAAVQRQGSTTVPVLVERVLTLTAVGQPAAARDLITKYPTLLGPLAQWLRMYVDAKDVKGGHAGEAKIKATQLDPPPDEAPLLLRLVAARGLAAVKDRRAKNYVKKLAKFYKAHPEILRALADVK